MAEENVTQTAPATAAPAASDAPSIGLADLQNAVKVIDYAAEQGAFKGWAVIEQVIAVRNKLNAFVASASPKEEAPAKEEAKKPAAKATKAPTKAPAKAEAAKATKAPAKAPAPAKAVKAKTTKAAK